LEGTQHPGGKKFDKRQRNASNRNKEYTKSGARRWERLFKPVNAVSTEQQQRGRKKFNRPQKKKWEGKPSEGLSKL